MVAVAEVEWQDMVDGNFPDTPAGQAFREAVATVAEQAKAALPDCHGRIDKAIAMSWLVMSRCIQMARPRSAARRAPRPIRSTAVAHAVTMRRPTEGRCKHRLSRWIQKKATTLATAQMQALDQPPSTSEQAKARRHSHQSSLAPLPFLPGRWWRFKASNSLPMAACWRWRIRKDSPASAPRSSA